ncbi:DsrE family protein [Bacillus sp. 1P06AnD]|uniref:DsrE family protein n=1 Tax=Bacillus sp. 1P06AnD TaxID=3132208 RepID=UPI0039A13316
MKVLFHIDSMDLWPMTIGNVRNLVDNFEESGQLFDVEIVANGEAVKGVIAKNGEKEAKQLAELAEKHVIIAACNNALTTYGLKPDDIHSFIKIVPAGVVEIAEKQQEGYNYIKP